MNPGREPIRMENAGEKIDIQAGPRRLRGIGAA